MELSVLNAWDADAKVKNGRSILPIVAVELSP